MKTTIKVIICLFYILILSGCNEKTHKKEETLSFSPGLEAEFNIQGFQPFPTYKYGNASLIDKIIPDMDYKYWECVFKIDPVFSKERGRIIVYNGDSLNYSSRVKNIDSDSGFLMECRPGVCFSYIVAVKPDDKIVLINTDNKLKKFIGHIDNIEEVILLTRINEYYYDEDTIIGGAYKERVNDYLLYLLEYSSSPVTYKSVRAILTKSGILQVLDKTIYKESDEYIIE